MATPSDNHGFDLNYANGDQWSYNEEFAALEERVPLIDTDANRSTYTPHADALYIASDTGDVHLGDGTDWAFLATLFDGSEFADATHDNTAHSTNYADTNHDNTAHSLEFLSDGDGVERQVWVSADGTTPAGAANDDIVLTPES